MLEQLTSQLEANRPLTPEDVRLAVAELVADNASVTLKADFLSRLAAKGETPEGITCFVRELRDRCLKPAIPPEFRSTEILDVVGTGGDRLSTFNISTTTALLAASAGVLVAKHGNRASTSPIGSADVMEALGLAFDLSPEEAVAALRQHGFTYFFAPRYHPAFRHIIPARRLCAERGERTIFNFLGPLLNPACPSAMLIGVPRPELCEPVAKVLQSLGVRRAMVVCGWVPHDGGMRYLDELSTLGPSTVAEFYQERGLTCSKLTPELFPIQAGTLEDLRGGNREINASIIRQVLSGRERGPKRDAVLLNAAAALFIAGKVRTLLEGWDLAVDLIDSGQAWRKFQSLMVGR